MRVIGVVSAALLGVCALTFCAPAAVASGGDGRSHGSGDGRSYGGGGGDEGRYSGGGGRSYGGGNGRSGHGGDDEEGRFGGRGGGGSEHYRHGVRAGVGGTVAGFDLKQIGLGTALIGGSLGTAYCLSRRRTGEEGTA
ncbi:hypothetical protein ACF09J_26535 [Streptomyces sp. NPDC014889]|uniref:hypothetical protein n=1 Tax=Streptomyces sp. NPDC014889 TaxID=3364928 RepID=UPI0036F88544